ncbi:MAG: pantetheine-phosphate adenylyltransferase [Acidimicrobiales bacterium]
MTTALYPGSFDPIHNGHLAIIEDAARIFDSVIVAVGHNPEKPSGFFLPEQRVELIRASLAHLPTVTVELFAGLVTSAAKELGATVLVKGIRGAIDLDAEMQQAHMNRTTASVPTVFLPANGDSASVSSTYVRQIAMMGGDISAVVPANIARAIAEKVS